MPPLTIGDAGGLAPVNVTVRLCFSKPSTVDRPWRKASPIIDKDKSCPYTLATLPVAESGAYTVTWVVPKAAPKAAKSPIAVAEVASPRPKRSSRAL